MSEETGSRYFFTTACNLPNTIVLKYNRQIFLTRTLNNNNLSYIITMRDNVNDRSNFFSDVILEFGALV